MEKYSIVVPVFNDELLIKETIARLTKIMISIGSDYELIFVNDGSKDSTSKLISDECKVDKKVKLIELAKNFGQGVAISAGIDFAVGDAVIVIDSDLQDPPELIPEMINKWKEGYKVVHSRRIQRSDGSLFKLLMSSAFYKILRFMTDNNMPIDHGEFRLIDKNVCNYIRGLKEKNRYFRGLVSLVGFDETCVEFVRKKRSVGTGHYSFFKLVKLAVDGIVSFSFKPIRIIFILGVIISFLSLMYILYMIWLKIIFDVPFEVWIFLIVTNFFLNGIILSSIGILGEYLCRVYDETRNRPLYIIKNKIGF